MLQHRYPLRMIVMRSPWGHGQVWFDDKWWLRTCSLRVDIAVNELRIRRHGVRRHVGVDVRMDRLIWNKVLLGECSEKCLHRYLGSDSGKSMYRSTRSIGSACGF